MIAGAPYSFQPSAADADLDKITFTIANKPAWASFTAETGALTGTPAATDVGAYPNIAIAATDGKLATSLPAFAITVSAAPAKHSVTIAWTPPTQNDDGSTLVDLKGYKIHYGTASGTYTGVISLDSAGLASYVIDSLPAGLNYIALTAYNVAGDESDYSTEVTATLN